jgi:hypothetical protein
MNGFVITQF